MQSQNLLTLTPGAGSSAPSTLPYYVKLLLWPGDARWNKGEAIGTPKSLTYSFMDAVPAVYNPIDGVWKEWEDLEVQEFKPLSTAQQEATRQALKLFSDVSGLTFVEGAPGTGNVQFGAAKVDVEVAVGWAYPPSKEEEFRDKQGHVWLNNNASGADNPLPGSDAFHTIFHELGHALGLKHPFDQFPNATLPQGERGNSFQYTIMAYDRHFEYGTLAASPNTLMLYDIAAIQYLYGANTQTRTGDDVYQWQTDATFLETIWDAGGTDTISAANQWRSVLINLNAGEFSSIGSNYGGAIDNVAIAFGVTIENAIGSSGSDEIYGNTAGNSLEGRAGDDLLDAGEGNDVLDGGTGKDTLSGGMGDDTYRVDHVLDRVTELAGEGLDGVIASTDYGLAESVENLTLSGNTAISGTGNELANRIDGNGANNSLSGGAGDDRLQGNAGDDALSGGENNDSLAGQEGNDLLVGEAGDDLLAGGTGRDRLNGGEGADRFVLSVADRQADVVQDFLRKQGDRLLVSAAEFGAGLKIGNLASRQFVLGSRAIDRNDRFIYQPSSGRLFFDADGIGKTQQIQIASLTRGTSLVSSSIGVTV